MKIGFKCPYRYPSINLSDYGSEGIYNTDGSINFDDRFKDPIWRIMNLYKISASEGGEAFPFVPNYPQRVVLYYVFILGRCRIAIPKSRQIGFSTLIAVIIYDYCLFNKGMECSIADRTHPDATKKLDKIRYTHNHMHPQLIQGMELGGSGVKKDNENELSWTTNNCIINAGKNIRGGTNQIIHVSEIGPICYLDPSRAKEIITGALPSASGRGAKVFFESTHMGGKHGYWYDILQSGLNVEEKYRTEVDWTVLFFPWWLDHKCILEGNIRMLDSDHIAYFRELEHRMDIKLDDNQKVFYYKKHQEQREEIYKEYPSSMDEMWKTRSDGDIYGELLDKAKADGRVNNNIRYDERFPVYVSKDLGNPVNTKAWLFQLIGDRIVFLESMSGGPECKTASSWTMRYKNRGYNYGLIVLPHDGEVSWKNEYIQSGMRDVICTPRQQDKWSEINMTISNFNRFEFWEEKCKDGLESIEAYHCKTESDDRTVKIMPIHDFSSHYCSALQTGSSAIHHGFIRDVGGAVASRGWGRDNRRIKVTKA